MDWITLEKEDVENYGIAAVKMLRDNRILTKKSIIKICNGNEDVAYKIELLLIDSGIAKKGLQTDTLLIASLKDIDDMCQRNYVLQFFLQRKNMEKEKVEINELRGQQIIDTRENIIDRKITRKRANWALAVSIASFVLALAVFMWSVFCRNANRTNQMPTQNCQAIFHNNDTPSREE